MDEEWRTIWDFPYYSVSNNGRVRNDATGRILSPSENQNGILQVGLSVHKEQFKRSVTVLVAHAFVPNRNGDAFDTPINLDGDRTNNRAENIVWRPRWFAIRYFRQFHQPPYEFTVPLYLVDTDEVFIDAREAAVKYGLLEKDIVLDLTNHTGVWPYNYDFRIYKE